VPRAPPGPERARGQRSAALVLLRSPPLVRPLAHPVTLAAIKADPELAEIALIRQSRLSVLPLTATEFKRILELGAKLSER
jgi:predicted RNA-binding protein with PUA-like domain